MPEPLPAAADVVIVGAGPAGLAAAVRLREAGVDSVLVLDREPEAGGIPRHCAHSPYGMREARRLLRGPAYARWLVAQAVAAGAEVRTGVSVAALHPGGRLAVTSDAGPSEIAARRVILATGARETPRAARLIGGTKPGGVLTTGALQGLVHLAHRAPFRRPVILGTELVAFSALLTCREGGIRPVAMIEQGPRTTARWPARWLPRLMGVPLHLGTDLLAIEGEGRVTGVVVRGPDGTTRRIACDGVVVTGRFRPEASLLQASHLAVDPATGGPVVDPQGRCSDPAYFAAGNLLRAVETAGACWAEGRAVAAAVARDLAGVRPERAQGTLRAEGDALAYALPQRIGGAGDAALDRVQLRLARPASGRLVLRRDGARVSEYLVASRPERRLSIPLPAGGTDTGAGDWTLTLEESP